MLEKIAQFFKEPPVKETIQDKEKVKSMVFSLAVENILCVFYRIYSILFV